jgi:hypothetical protein
MFFRPAGLDFTRDLVPSAQALGYFHKNLGIQVGKQPDKQTFNI